MTEEHNARGKMDLDKVRHIMDCITIQPGADIDLNAAFDALGAGEELRTVRDQGVIKDRVLVEAGGALRYVWAKLNPHGRQQPKTVATLHDQFARIRAAY